MIEVLPFDHPDYEFGSHPFDGLAVFHDDVFVREWSKGERRIKIAMHAQPDTLDTIMRESSDTLDTLYDTDYLIYKPADAAGKIYKIPKNSANEIVTDHTEIIDAMRLRFEGISFVFVKNRGKKGIDGYLAAFKFSPIDKSSDPRTSHYYMLLDDAEKLEFPDEPAVPMVDPQEYEEILNTILDDSRKYKEEIDYDLVTKEDQEKMLDDRAKEYSKRLMPLIDQKVPLLIDTTAFEGTARGKTAPVPNKRTELKPDNDKYIIAGHLIRIAFIGNALKAKNTPRLVVENNVKGMTYTVPIDSEFRIYSL